ncbi:DUF6083 domain-containing protein [Streptomyces sp. NPDC057445]|uniref:DUF6083 domain-containing protein n=1 Tax=Streptomyces sp. NPDC057445 TaxID=3346136 RepID=UPI00367DA1DE
MAVLCERCWNEHANEIAVHEGATDPPRPEPGPDDVTGYEPPRCRHCKADVVPCLTNYDRWVHLDTTELPAKDVPPRHRWRVVTIRDRRSGVPSVVAVRVRGVVPLPGEFVRPAHRAVCLDPDAGDEVRRGSD